MNIGILTFSSVFNYGAVLQAYALREYISSISTNNKVYVIDYNPKYLQEKYRLPSLASIIKHSSIKNVFNSLNCYNDLKKKNNSFNQFRSRYLNTNSLETLYDYVVLGSDQIWNKKLTNNCLDRYFWGNAFSAKSKIISYAASSGDGIEKEDIPNIKYNLNLLEHISVREQQSAITLSEICGKEIKVVLDPVFLLTPIEWKQLCNHSKTEQYIFVYYFGDDLKLFAKIENYAHHNGYKVIYCTTGYCNRTGFDNTTSPIDFITYIKDASLVITNSFHATAFSIIFRTNFISIKRKDGNNLRISNLLTVSNAKDSFMNSDDVTPSLISDVINGTNDSYENLEKLIEVSKNYLLNAFQNEE